jgi:peptidoglycan/xylan/chitin deacetylase (PgdA/CDA1 family)
LVIARLKERNKILRVLSQIGDVFKSQLDTPKTVLEKGTLIMSIDVDVGNKELGIVNKGKNDQNVSTVFSEYSIGLTEELALPMFLSLFEEFETQVTFAIRGQWLQLPNAALYRLLETSVKHDLGAHGYYHRNFKRLSHKEAENELAEVQTAMNRFNLAPSSFVFPGNNIAHLNLLPNHGFKCYRGYGGFLRDGMYIQRHRQLYDVHPSLYIDQHSNLRLMKKFLELSSKRKLPLHLWFHLWSCGRTENTIQKSMRNMFQPFLQYAKSEVKDGRLDVETMASVLQKVHYHADRES